ncbi:MAG: nuclear transport factor 2 family protein [Cyanobacteria bacterium P01_A01_bin.114]
MSPTEVIREFIKRFNAADVDGLAALYAPDAINHQVVTHPLHGRDAIRQMFEIEFDRATMVCLEENLFEAGDWGILEWRDPLGLRGCGFFQIKDDLIVFQRGYFDQLTFFKQHGLPVPAEYLTPVTSEAPDSSS